VLIFDAHCDILSKIGKASELLSNRRHWDVLRALRYGCYVQVLTCFADDPYRSFPRQHMLAQFMLGLQAERELSDQLTIIRSRKELEGIREGHVYGILGAEGAEILGGSLAELDRLYQLGLRIMTLSWNYDNEVCDSVAGHNTHHGLSSFGKQVVRRMESLGVVVDVSHISDKSLEDVLEVAKKPVTASHSNARALCGHRRNLTDSQIQRIASGGGVIGINLFPPFLEYSGNAGIMSIIKHIDYIAGLAGTGAIGLGCDFDGMNELPDGISGVESLHSILNMLARMNYSDRDIEGISGKNYVRLFTQILN
jgi:membrane dipeptidase